MSNKPRIEPQEFQLAMVIGRGRLSDLPNILFVIEKYIEQLESDLREANSLLDKLQQQDLAEHG